MSRNPKFYEVSEPEPLRMGFKEVWGSWVDPFVGVGPAAAHLARGGLLRGWDWGHTLYNE